MIAELKKSDAEGDFVGAEAVFAAVFPADFGTIRSLLHQLLCSYTRLALRIHCFQPST